MKTREEYPPPKVDGGGWMCLRGMPKSTLEGNERGLAVPARFVLRLKNTNSGFIWRKGRDSHADHRSIDYKKSR